MSDTIYLAGYRERAKMSQREASDALGISKTTLFLWERGDNSPTVRDLMRLARVYKIEPTAFFSPPGLTSANAKRADSLKQVRAAAAIAGVRPGAYVEFNGDLTDLDDVEELSSVLHEFRSMPAQFRRRTTDIIRTMSALAVEVESA